MLRLLSLILLFALPSHAVYDLGEKRIQLMSATCTDSNDTPATTSGQDLTTTTNWDFQGGTEMPDPSLNLEDAEQVSGSADGWCDTTPWVIAMNAVVEGGDVTQVIGPFIYPAQGWYVFQECDSVGTDLNYRWDVQTPWEENTSSTPIYTMTDVTGTRNLLYFGPHEDTVAGGVTKPIPGDMRGVLLWGRDGAGTWTCDVWILPALNPNTSY
ncbi:MAG: hypothetical protein V3S01_09355 [Dehalococcoidia bacterium]